MELENIGLALGRLFGAIAIVQMRDGDDLHWGGGREGDKGWMIS
jgi:hypothetical protein